MFINGRDAQIVKFSYRKIKDVIILHVYANINFVINAQANGKLIIIVHRQIYIGSKDRDNTGDRAELGVDHVCFVFVTLHCHRYLF